MATLAELFNPTFFLFLGILVLVVALMVLYYESKIRDQNHKIASMLSLVSTLAEDLNSVKFGLNHVAMRHGGSHQQSDKPLEQETNNTIGKSTSHLITVSDDEDDSDDEGDTDDETDGSDEDDHDETDDDETDDDESIDNQNNDTKFDYNSDGIIFTNDFNNVKILKLNIFSQDDAHNEDKYEANSKIEEIDENSFNNDAESIEDLEEINDEASVSISIMSELPYDELPDDELSDDELPNHDDLEELTIDNKNGANKNISASVNNTSSGDFKRIAINLGEDQPAEQVDYKKLQLPKLRSIAVEKGLTSNSEASKLKKQDLLKMLESE